MGNITPNTCWNVALDDIDIVIHLAAPAHVMRDNASNPLEEVRRINTEATLNLARQAAKSVVKRFIYLSSIKANGEVTLTKYPFTEKDSGIYDAMNKGIDLAKGEWINFMNGGDCFFTEMVLNEVFFDDCYEDTDILYGNHQVRYSSGSKRDVQAGDIKNLWKGSQFCHQASFTRANYHKLFKFNLCTKIVADFEFFYDAWKNQASFKATPLTVVSFEAGGVSDIKRIDTILGWWQIVDKSFMVNKYYLFSLVKELVKDLIKRKRF